MRPSWVAPRLMRLAKPVNNKHLFKICCSGSTLVCVWGGSGEAESQELLRGFGAQVRGSILRPPGHVSGTLLPPESLFPSWKVWATSSCGSSGGTGAQVSGHGGGTGQTVGAEAAPYKSSLRELSQAAAASAGLSGGGCPPLPAHGQRSM